MNRLPQTMVAILIGTALLAVGARAVAQPAPATPPPAQKSGLPTKWIPPVKGQAEVGYLPPQTKVMKDEVVTTFKVKNLSTGSIAGLQIDEYWWDKANNPNPVGGDRKRLPKPLMPGEVATIVLRTQKNPQMHRNTYQFSHANGKVKTKILKKID